MAARPFAPSTSTAPAAQLPAKPMLRSPSAPVRVSPRAAVRVGRPSAGSVGLCIRLRCDVCPRSRRLRAYDDAVTDHDTAKLTRDAALRRGRTSRLPRRSSTSAPVDHASRTGWGRTARQPPRARHRRRRRSRAELLGLDAAVRAAASGGERRVARRPLRVGPWRRHPGSSPSAGAPEWRRRPCSRTAPQRQRSAW